MNWWSVLKTYTDETGAPMHQPETGALMRTTAKYGPPIDPNDAYNRPMQSAQPQPPEQEESKPLYDQKQQLGIAHYLLDDIQQIAQLLRELHDHDGEADWERLLFDIERIKQILEDALTGGGPKPSGGGI